MDSDRSRLLLIHIFFVLFLLLDLRAVNNVIVPQASINPAAAVVVPPVQPATGAPPASPAQNLTASSSPVVLRTPAKNLFAAPADQSAAATSITTNNNIQNDDPIVYVDYSSINDEVLRKGTANFVYFNANFNHCRHCHKFFQLWKELAVDIRWWRQAIKLFAINCSDEDNIDICRRAGVTQFPQVKYYWVMSNSLDQDGQRVRILGKSVHAMRHLIMDKVLDSYTEHNRLLSQQVQQRQKSSVAAANPALALLTGSLGGASSTTQASPPSSNSLLSMLGPMFGQLMAGSGLGNAGGGSGGGSTGSGGLGGLVSLLGSLTGSSSGTGAATGDTTTALTAVPKNPLASLSGFVSQMGGLQKVSQLVGSLMGGLGSMRQRMAQPLANSWPELRPIEVSNTVQLLDQLPLDAASKPNFGVLLVLETQEFMYTGLEVLLDLSPYANQTHMVRVRDELSQLSRNLTKRDDIQAPTLIYVTPTKESRLLMTAPKYTNDEDLRRAFVRGFERRQVKYPVRRVWSSSVQAGTGSSSGNGGGGGGDLSQEDEELLGKLHQVHMNDLTNALRASLMEQVFRHSDLSDDQYNALVKYVYALINYFPFNDEEALKFVKRLHSWLQNQVSLMDIGEYKKQFHDIDEHIPQRDWVACKSLSNTKSIPIKSKKSGSFLFENPAQFGKVVSNLTRLFRNQQQQMSKLKSLFKSFAGSSNLNVNAPVMLSNKGQGRGSYTNGSTTTSAPAQGSSSASSVSSASKAPQQSTADGDKKSESPIERLIKSLTSGSLGSDSSILKLISTALTGAQSSSSAPGGRSKFAREYPCGAWKLAHAMVANEYIKDSPRKDVRHIVLHSLHQYMLHFYSCPTCGNRVSDVSGEFRIQLDTQLQDQGDSVLLLWKLHNRVSRRLESESRPGLPPKSQFPSESLCAKCRAPRAQGDFVSTPSWHDKQVLNFLVHHYRPQSIINGGGGGSSNSSASSSAIASAILLSQSSLLFGHFFATVASIGVVAMISVLAGKR